MAANPQNTEQDGTVKYKALVTARNEQDPENDGKRRQGDGDSAQNTLEPKARVIKTVLFEIPKDTTVPKVDVTVIHFQGSFFTVPTSILAHVPVAHEETVAAT